MSVADVNALAWRLRRRLLGPGIARDVTHAGPGRPRALLLYAIAAFRDGRNTHQHVMQSHIIARLLHERGYALDVVEWSERRRELLAPQYALVIELHPVEDPLYAGRLAAGAPRIGYITGRNPAVAAAAERARLEALYARRGVRLTSRRHAQAPFTNSALASLDAITLFDGATTRASFAGFDLPPVYPLVNCGYEVEPTNPDHRDPRRFLFLAGAGMVAKGLDVLLEAIAGEPDLELVICAPFARERDFTAAYRRELTAPNVSAVGVVDVCSDRFRALQAGCGTMVAPSSSEAQCGVVTVALSYGLPCLATPECGFDEPMLRTLQDCSVEGLRRALRERAAWSRAQLGGASGEAYALACARYRPDHYASGIRALLEGVGMRA